MNEATVTSRMSAIKKMQVQEILERNGTNLSRVINTVFDRIAKEDGIGFLAETEKEKHTFKKESLARSIEFVDSIPIEKKSKFDEMSKNEIKMLRLKDKGLLWVSLA